MSDTTLSDSSSHASEKRRHKKKNKTKKQDPLSEIRGFVQDPIVLKTGEDQRNLDKKFIKEAKEKQLLLPMQDVEEQSKLGEEEFFRAKVFVEDAMNARDTNHRTDIPALKIYDFAHRRSTRLALLGFIFVHLMLAYFESPSPYRAPLGVTEAIELVCLLSYAADIWMKWQYYEPHIFWEKWWIRIKILFVALNFIDIIVYLGVGDDDLVRFSRFLRVFYLVEYNSTVKHFFVQALKTEIRMLEFEVSFVFMVVTWALFGMIIFSGWNQDTGYFTDFVDSFLAIFVMITTANFPDVMLPAYRISPWYCIYFIFFIVIALYLMLNLGLALVNQSYRKHGKEQGLDNYFRRRHALLAAFRVLDQNKSGSITFNEWKSFYSFSRPDASIAEANYIYKMLGKHPNSQIDAYEFFGLCDILFLYIQQSDLLKVPLYGRTLVFPSLQKVVNHHVFESAVILTTIGYGIVQLVDIVDTLDVRDASQLWRWTAILGYALLLLFLVEIAMRILAVGWRNYLSPWTAFDIGSVTAAVVMRVLTIIVLSADYNGLMNQIARSISLLIFLRVFTVSKRLREKITTLFQLANVLLRFSSLIIILFYFYALLGIALYKNKLVRSNTDLKGTDYDRNDYYDFITFNNFHEAMLTCFHLMVVNNWVVTVNGVKAAVGSWCLLYFLSFYFLTVIVYLNLVISFILETFMITWKVNKRRQLHLNLASAPGSMPRSNSSLKLVPINSAASPGAFMNSTDSGMTIGSPVSPEIPTTVGGSKGQDFPPPAPPLPPEAWEGMSKKEAHAFKRLEQARLRKQLSLHIKKQFHGKVNTLFFNKNTEMLVDDVLMGDALDMELEEELSYHSQYGSLKMPSAPDGPAPEEVTISTNLAMRAMVNAIGASPFNGAYSVGDSQMGNDGDSRDADDDGPLPVVHQIPQREVVITVSSPPEDITRVEMDDKIEPPPTDPKD